MKSPEKDEKDEKENDDSAFNLANDISPEKEEDDSFSFDSDEDDVISLSGQRQT